MVVSDSSDDDLPQCDDDSDSSDDEGEDDNDDYIQHLLVSCVLHVESQKRPPRKQREPLPARDGFWERDVLSGLCYIYLPWGLALTD